MKKNRILIITVLILMLFGSGKIINEKISVFYNQGVENRAKVASKNGSLQEESNGTKNTNNTQENSEDKSQKDYIKWVEFNVTCEAMDKAYQYDIDTYTKEVHLDWVDLLAYLGAKYGGDFSKYKGKDMDEIAEPLLSGEKTVKGLLKDMEFFSYYREAYGAVLNGMVGEYQMEYPVSADEEKLTENTEIPDSDSNKDKSGTTAKTAWKKVYGLKAYHPIAKGFAYSSYDDFGSSRSYGYKRRHLGHDMMGQVGTPIIAVESGYVAELGWNQYGGWRIGINSFDGKRYYYYAHLRKDVPYAEGLEKGDVIQAGDVIGYLGRTGYSVEENVNNIEAYHLHFGLQLIFNEVQRDCDNEIWVSGYELMKFLYKHRSETQRNSETKEWTRVYDIKDPAVEAWEEQKNNL